MLERFNVIYKDDYLVKMTFNVKLQENLCYFGANDFVIINELYFGHINFVIVLELLLLLVMKVVIIIINQNFNY